MENKKVVRKKSIISDVFLILLSLSIIYLFASEALLKYNQRKDMFVENEMEENLKYEEDQSSFSARTKDLKTTGVLYVPSIDLTIPIYEDTLDQYINMPSEEAMSSGAARMRRYNDLGDVDKGVTDSSKVVLTAHTGLSIGALFNNVPKMEVGDMFYVKDLRDDEIYAYETTERIIVSPEEVEVLYPEENKDQMTLLTCYPIFINSERAVITGDRTEYTEGFVDLEESSLISALLESKFFIIGVILFVLSIVKTIRDILYNRRLEKLIIKEKES